MKYNDVIMRGTKRECVSVVGKSLPTCHPTLTQPAAFLAPLSSLPSLRPSTDTKSADLRKAAK